MVCYITRGTKTTKVPTTDLKIRRVSWMIEMGLKAKRDKEESESENRV